MKKPLLILVIRELIKLGFSYKDRDTSNDKRLGIHLSLSNYAGQYIEIYDEDTYWHILHYGLSKQYLPIGFDVLSLNDVQDYSKFLNQKLKQSKRMDEQTALRILKHFQKWRLGLVDEIPYSPKDLTEALNELIKEVESNLKSK